MRNPYAGVSRCVLLAVALLFVGCGSGEASLAEADEVDREASSDIPASHPDANDEVRQDQLESRDLLDLDAASGNADLVDVELVDADLADVNLSDAELVDVDLSDAELVDVDVSDAELVDADLVDVESDETGWEDLDIQEMDDEDTGPDDTKPDETGCIEDVCGDGVCSMSENCFFCPEDCGECCGNGWCEDYFGEDCATCPEDCGCTDCGVECVDGNCTFTACEDRECGEDGCGGICGECGEHHSCTENGQCHHIPWCGDLECDPEEDCFTCPQDCGECCGNQMCEPLFGENCATCLQDCPCGCGESCVEEACTFTACLGRECNPDGCGGTCGTCDSRHLCSDGLCVYEPACDNGICDPNETCFTCPQDCGECCGNNLCEPDYGEDCDTCPGDCGCVECGFECVNAVCTFTACDGRECGPDGCDGSCGDCAVHQICTEEGVCLDVSWCGDGVCDGDEDCESCPEDCGECGIECPPDMALVDDSFCMDIYEASRPDATATFIGTVTTHATSRPGVMPWGGTSSAVQVLYATGRAACEAAGKRLCTEAEMNLACGGKANLPYVYGSQYIADACNGIDAYCNCNVAPCSGYEECPYPHCRLYSPEGVYGYGCGAAFRIAPTGAFPQCVNEWGNYDLNGNVWELMDSGNTQSWYKGGAFNCGNSEFLHQCGLKYSSTQVNALGFRCCK